eukprot:36098-Eustigmatos_ZCMA.PRE.1
MAPRARANGRPIPVGEVPRKAEEAGAVYWSAGVPLVVWDSQSTGSSGRLGQERETGPSQEAASRPAQSGQRTR